MGQENIPKPDQSAPPTKSTAILLLRDIGDTTWRMFIPTIGLTLLGAWADSSLNTQPIGLIAGIVAGSIVAYFLIRTQLKTVNKDI